MGTYSGWETIVIRSYETDTERTTPNLLGRQRAGGVPEAKAGLKQEISGPPCSIKNTASVMKRTKRCIYVYVRISLHMKIPQPESSLFRTRLMNLKRHSFESPSQLFFCFSNKKRLHERRLFVM